MPMICPKRIGKESKIKEYDSLYSSGRETDKMNTYFSELSSMVVHIKESLKEDSRK